MAEVNTNDIPRDFTSKSQRAEVEARAKGQTPEQRYERAVRDAGEFVAAAMNGTGQTPASSVGYDAIFRDAGIAPTTDTRMAAISLGRRLYGDRAEVARLAGQRSTQHHDQMVAAATNTAKAELKRVVEDRTCDLQAIFAAVIALRQATGQAHAADSVTFEEAVERAVQARYKSV